MEKIVANMQKSYCIMIAVWLYCYICAYSITKQKKTEKTK